MDCLMGLVKSSMTMGLCMRGVSMQEWPSANMLCLSDAMAVSIVAVLDRIGPMAMGSYRLLDCF
jgi:hypothetical protein